LYPMGRLRVLRMVRGNAMLIGKPQDIRSSEITPLGVYQDRRKFMTNAGLLGAGAIAAGMMPEQAFGAGALTTTHNPKYTLPDKVTPQKNSTTYNNFYEYGVEKTDPAENAHIFKTRPWTVEVSGLVKKKQTLDIDTIMKYRPLEDRVYRFRCVEAWSMVIPWVGYPLADFINAMEPLPSAKYVQFISYLNKVQMSHLPGDYDWPYSEGLRMDEAMNPLSLLTFGAYGDVLANQQGAPMRVILPWKYGFKSAKSIVKIVFTDKQPRTLWNEIMSATYGFYSNVNPDVSKTPWSQAKERRLDGGFPKGLMTQMFNGYGDQVASMYSGMDLKKNY
jgi:sulfoxide reductase catalytic subunit YedY